MLTVKNFSYIYRIDFPKNKDHGENLRLDMHLITIANTPINIIEPKAALHLTITLNITR